MLCARGHLALGGSLLLLVCYRPYACSGDRISKFEMEQQEGGCEDWPAEVGFREKRRKNPLQRLILEEAYQGSSCLLKFGFFFSSCFLWASISV